MQTHVLVIPKERDGLTSVNEAEDRHALVLGRMILAAKEVRGTLSDVMIDSPTDRLSRIPSLT